MSLSQSNTYLEWIKLAEELIKQGNYETAANHIRRVAHHFKLNKDMTRFIDYMRKTGDCFLKAAEDLRNSNQYEKASLLFIKAVDCYKEIGDYDLVKNYSLKIHEYYAMMVKDTFTNFQGSALDLKYLGDYFRAENDIEKARICYEVSALKALEQGNLLLAAGYYRDAGDCSSFLNDVKRAEVNYLAAADNYFKSKEHYEAAWYYNISGFLLVSLRRFDEALLMARKAKQSCFEGNIPVLLNRLSLVCELLSQKRNEKAEKEWQEIRRKFKRTFINLVDSCFSQSRIEKD